MSWLVDSAADVHVCNNLDLMTEYHKKQTWIGSSTLNGVSAGRGKMRLWLSQKDGSEGVILDLKDVFFLPSSPSNLVSLVLLNNTGIFHNNENETFYDIRTKEVLAQAKRWNNSFSLQPLNLSDAAVNLVKRVDKMYQWPTFVHQTRLGSAKQTLLIWHKRLGHLNFQFLRSHLKRFHVDYINKPDHLICDSCQRAKATKVYNWNP